jgi:hypothetical protein
VNGACGGVASGLRCIVIKVRKAEPRAVSCTCANVRFAKTSTSSRGNGLGDLRDALEFLSIGGW